MEKTENRRDRYNLYYIFEADRLAHPMPSAAAQRMREKISELLSEKSKPTNNADPPDL